jgi:hypothetical protein
MKRFVIAMLFSTMPALAASGSFAGTWQVNGSVAGNTVNRSCKFNQDGNQLSGSCENTEDKADKVSLLTGEIKEKTVTWKFDANWQGSTLTATYTGDWDGDSAMMGTIDVQPVNAAGTFTAAKEK